MYVLLSYFYSPEVKVRMNKAIHTQLYAMLAQGKTYGKNTLGNVERSTLVQKNTHTFLPTSGMALAFTCPLGS